MTPERHAKVRDIFLETVSRPTDQRTAYLIETCGPDAELRREVELLLSHHADGDESRDAGSAAGELQPIPNQAPEVASSGRNAAVAPGDAAQVADSELVAGQMVSGRYRIQCKLGQGGTGVVYRAEDMVLNGTTAIKFLASTSSHSPAMRDAFRSEVRMAHRVSHRNVCRVFDIGEADGQTFLTMEFCDGEDLARLIRRVGRLSSDKGYDIARQLCTGLAAAHGAGVLHRDIKPSNILLDLNGKVMISDFGIAAALGAAGIRDTAGTPGYMAPEQIIGMGVDQRSDIYSLGLVFYELFSGRPAFVEESVSAYLERQLLSQPAPISEIVPDFDRNLESLIHQCISKNRDQRPSSALAVAAALPGTDALALALEVNQTASPSLVGNAIELAGRLPRPGIWAAIVLFGCFLLPLVRGWSGYPWDNRDSRPPSVLIEQAKSLTRVFAADVPGRYSAHGYCDRSRARFLAEQFVGPLPEDFLVGPQRGLFFWYRESSAPLVPLSVETLIFGSGQTTSIDPPFSSAAQSLVLLDDQGRLVELAHKGLEADQSAQRRANRLPELIVAAQLGDVDSQPAPISWGLPGMQRACEIRKAMLSDSISGYLVTCEWLESLGVFFVMEPKPSVVSSIRAIDTQLRTMLAKDSRRFLYVIATLLSLPFAMRNLRKMRGDLQGASRLGSYFFLINIVSWLLDTSHGSTVNEEIALVSVAVLRALGLAAMVMVLYLTLEPLTRRYWPHLMIVWTRLLQGRPLTPVFWQHVLVGIATGCLLSILMAADYAVVRTIWNWPAEPLFDQQVAQRFLGLGALLSAVCVSAQSAAGKGLLVIALMAAVRWAVGGVRLALLLVGAILLFFIMLRGASTDIFTILAAVLAAGVALWVMIRFGLLSFVLMLFVADVLNSTPMTLRPTDWFFPVSTATLVAIAAIATYAYAKARIGVEQCVQWA